MTAQNPAARRPIGMRALRTLFRTIGSAFLRHIRRMPCPARSSFILKPVSSIRWMESSSPCRASGCACGRMRCRSGRLCKKTGVTSSRLKQLEQRRARSTRLGGHACVLCFDRLVRAAAQKCHARGAPPRPMHAREPAAFWLSITPTSWPPVSCGGKAAGRRCRWSFRHAPPFERDSIARFLFPHFRAPVGA